MSQATRCPECGAELPSGSLQGLCPKCLLAAGLESRDDEGRSAGSGSEAPTTPHSGSFVPPAPATLAAHFPQLEILELLGHGGMGAVYKARQPRLDRLVALKIIRPESADTPAFAERFNREAKTLARLSHPQIVAVYDFGSVDISLRQMMPLAEREAYTELYYFVMEYVDGANLRQLMRAGELTPEQALAIVPQICDALEFAHNEGVVHRDIKPENILLDKRGRVKIADFGLAKLAGHTPDEFTLTGTHQVMGTPRYMAPEQMEGSHAVDHRADIYSLGVVFYEMLTGEVPMGHFEPPSKKVEIDVRLDEVVLRSLAREPERRYQHASDVKTDIESISGSVRADMTSPAISDATDDSGEESWRGFLWGVVHICIVVILFLFGLGILMGGEDALRPLGIRATGIWVRAAQLGALILMITAGLSLGYEWRIPSRRRTGRKGDRFASAPHTLAREPERRYQHASDVKSEVESISGSLGPAAITPPSPDAADEKIDAARQMVQFPAIGLIVIGGLSLALGVLVALMMSTWAFRRDGSNGMQFFLALPAILIFTALPTAMIVGGVKMLRLTNYRWAVGASVLAVSPIPAGPLWLLSLPLGIWSLVVLAKPEVKRAFASGGKPLVPSEPDAVHRVQNPAWGLIITGIISWITIPLAFWIPIVRDLDAAQRIVFQISFGIVPLVVGTIMALAGFRMKRLEGYWLAMFAAVLPIIVLVFKLFGTTFEALAINPADLVGVPMGLWALVVLARPEVKRAFARRSELAAPHAPQAKVGTPVAHVQFSVPATKDVASRIVFHFSGLGYRIVDERPNEWVFERGTTLAALYETDIRLLKTTLTVRTVSGDEGRVCVSCHWAVRTLGLAQVTRRDVRDLEAEGRELAVLLGGGGADGVLGQVEQVKPEDLVHTPALLLTIAGGILTFWLILGLGGIMAEGFDVWWPCLVGPVILIAGISMGRLCAYWLAVVGSLMCLPAAILPVWGWFAFGAGLFSLSRLMRPEVREAFRHRALRSESPSNEAKSEPQPRGTLGRAWDDWWTERERWVTKLVQTVLLLVFIACLWVWVGFRTKSNLLPANEGERLRETTFEFGVQGSPWFRFHMNPSGDPGWNWDINWISWSSAIMLLGFLAWCVSWQIEKTQANATGTMLRWWHGSPNLAIIIWLVLTVLALALGHSPLFMERMENSRSRSNSEAIEKENDHGAQKTTNAKSLPAVTALCGYSTGAWGSCTCGFAALTSASVARRYLMCADSRSWSPSAGTSYTCPGRLLIRPCLDRIVKPRARSSSLTNRMKTVCMADEGGLRPLIAVLC